MTEDWVIQTSELSKTYGGGWFSRSIEAVKGLDLKVAAGGIHALLGPNGAGKTTTIKMLLGMVKPTRGSGRLLGIDIRRFACRRRVGYLPENQRFPPYLSAFSVLDTFGGLQGMPRRDRRNKADAALDQVGLLKWKTTGVGKFSKGMHQRLGIALALFHDPELVILDEPTDGVDPQGRRDIRDMIASQKEQGRTVLLNSHLLQEVEVVADHLTILKEGNVIHRGDVATLTGSDCIYHVRLSPPSKAKEADLEDLLQPAGQPGLFRFQARDDAALDRVVECVRAAGLTIRELFPLKKSLEEVFLELVNRPDEPAKARAGGGRP